ncbi:MAG: metallophosphoesterase [Paludibacteraceae bacterium]|nr:metallophosphoesterase [Paludibacteraceae bacterium]
MKKIFFWAALFPLLSFAQERIMVIADPHVLPQSVIEQETDFDEYMKTQRKMLDLSEPIWHALLDTALKYKPDLVLIPGDLTRDGETAAHDTVSAGILRLQAAGIRTLVIPGNHDLPGDNWETLYPGTFEDAVKDADSYSFAVEPISGLTVIGIDGSDGNASVGKLSDATQAWIRKQADAAVGKGNMVIAMTHWQILEHFDQQGTLESACRFTNADELRDDLMHHGVHLVLTGHFHVNGITTFRDTTGLTNDSLVEITTGSPITYPCPYRWLTLSADRKQVAVTTDYVTTVDTIADLMTYGREWMYEHTQNMIPGLARRTWGKVMDKWDEKVVPALEQAGVGSYIIAAIKMLLPQDEESQVAITQKYLGEPAANLYLFHSEANENKRPELGETVANAVYEGMNGIVEEIFYGPMAVVQPTFKGLARAIVEVPVQSLVEDKTQRQSALYADVTDDLHPTLYINAAEPQGFEEIEEIPCAGKYIRQGQLLIQKGERIYTPQGQQIAQ